jgi:hypothetical protein
LAGDGSGRKITNLQKSSIIDGGWMGSGSKTDGIQPKLQNSECWI